MEDFIFKPFAEMTYEDYQRVGFMSGLEVHQQLLTDKKLFCRCPAGKFQTTHHAEILRHMRPTLSELGEYDGTALMEFKTKKEIIYRINRETVCTYEMDDNPPFEINEQALDRAVEISLLYDANVVDELHIARKQYLDGSIPTGFQRTAIVCVDGKIPYKDGIIDVVQLSIEEDSCREVSDIGHRRIYKTDRLGMPLIETVTAPQMKTPLEVAEVCQIIRRAGRATGHVRTGMGAGREDVNVSVTGGTRIEIKGVPKITAIPLLTYNEAMRQWNLLRLREELKKRGVTPETFTAVSEDVTKFVKKSRYMPINIAIQNGGCVSAVVLKKFQGLLRWQTQTDTYFSREISDRVRVIACLTTLPNIINSDSLSENIAASEWRAIKKQVQASDEDTVVIVWGAEGDVVTAVKEIIIRAKEATVGIPSETRQALRDGTNGFERILPGADRMYPDTDLPPKQVSDDRKAEIKAGLPIDYWTREKRYTEMGIPKENVLPLSISKFANIFEKAVKEYKINPTLASIALINFPKRLKKIFDEVDILSPEFMDLVLKALADGKIVKDGVYVAMETALVEGNADESVLPTIATKDEIDSAIQEAKEEMASLPLLCQDNYNVILMEITMKWLRGRANGADIAKLLGLKEGK